MLSAWLVLGETPGLIKQVGIGLILFALLIITLYQRRKQRQVPRQSAD